MRIRSTRPEFWRSERIASVDWDARLVLKGLESFVDDNGVGKDDLALIVGDLFSRDLVREPSRTLARVSEAISDLSEAGLLWRYEVDGTQLLFIAFWDEIQRVDKAQSGRFRRPDGTINYKESVIRESSTTPREPSRILAPVTGEQGNRGTGEKLIRPAEPDGFEEFWETYPRREARRKAAAAFGRALRRASLEDILAGAKRYAAVPRERQFTKLPEGWLNGDQWSDEVTPAVVNGRSFGAADGKGGRGFDY